MAASMRHLCLFRPVIRNKWLFMRTFATRRPQARTTSGYEATLAARRKQADRSFLVSIGGPIGELYRLCARNGTVAAIFPFSNNTKTYALVEMRTEAGLLAVLDEAQQFPNTDRIPSHARFLYMMHVNRHSRVHVPTTVLQKTPTPPDLESLNSRLGICSSVSRQVELLYAKTKMSELASRLRFLLISVLQETLRGTLHTCQLTPFGSSVNGFGRHNCDLDLLLEIDNSRKGLRDELGGSLYHMSKVKQDNGRYQSQLALDTIGGIISHFTPQFSRVHRILRARVPIVKFQHIGTSIECDLCISDRSGLYMSELLHLFGECDKRVRPLVYAVRHWAANADVTHSMVGPWISNFMLTWFVVYFLQVTSQPVLPSIATLRRMARPRDRKEVDGEDMTFLTDWTKVPFYENTQSLHELLRDFFDLYATHDFSKFGISVVDACTISKPIPEVPMHLENPLQRNLNASKNVSADQVVKWQEACAKASHELCGATPLSVLSETSSTADSACDAVPLEVKDAHHKQSSEQGVNETFKVNMTKLFDEDKSSTHRMSTNNQLLEEELTEGDRGDDDVSSPLTGTYKDYIEIERDRTRADVVASAQTVSVINDETESEPTVGQDNQRAIISEIRSQDR